MCVYVPCVCLMLMKVRIGLWIPGTRVIEGWGCGYWESKLAFSKCSSLPSRRPSPFTSLIYVQ